MGSGEGKVVCVTGANGYMATWLVKFLLLRGYTVKGTVRNPNDAKKTEHLLKLEGAKERLHLFKADLLDEGSYDSAVEGCEGVFHMASPCFNDTKNPEADLVEPAVKGTLNVLRSCAKSPCLKRVILTSSIAAVAYNWTPRTADVVIDETWYSDPEYLKQNNMWYLLSKYLAEETAWKFVKEHNIDMVALHAGMVIGPLLQPTINESADSVLKLLNGVKTYPNFVIGWVHVQDVINAHIQAYEIPSANGRYLLIESVQHYADIVRILRELFPTLELPEKCEDDNPLRPRYQVSKEKAKSLGIDFIPIEVSLKETLESFKEKKFVNY